MTHLEGRLGRPLAVASHSSHRELAPVKRKVQSADQYASNREDIAGDVRVNELIEVMKQEPALIGLDPGFCFEPVLNQR